MKLGREDNGTHIELTLRDSLEVHLPESQVSGYMWQFAGNSYPCLRLVDSIYVEKGPARFNGLGERIWFFSTKDPGQCDLIFSLVRPWSKPSPEFILKITLNNHF
jgi:inhibitor of cysteine peptidase